MNESSKVKNDNHGALARDGRRRIVVWLVGWRYFWFLAHCWCLVWLKSSVMRWWVQNMFAICRIIMKKSKF